MLLGFLHPCLLLDDIKSLTAENLSDEPSKRRFKPRRQVDSVCVQVCLSKQTFVTVCLIIIFLIFQTDIQR